jgi:hypothetical protein
MAKGKKRGGARALGRELAAAELDVHDERLRGDIRRERRSVVNRDGDWREREAELTQLLANEFQGFPEMVEMILSGGKSTLVAPDHRSMGSQSGLIRFRDTGVVVPNAAGDVSFCLTAWTQFICCLYTGGVATVSIGNQIGGNPNARSSKRDVFAQSLFRSWRAIAGGLDMWLTGDFQQTEGQIAVAVIPNTAVVGTDFSSVADLPGAVVMAAADVYQRGLFVPLLLASSEAAITVGAVIQRLIWSLGLFENFQAVDLTALSMFLQSQVVRPTIMVAATGLDPAARLLCSFRHAYQYVPLFDIGNSPTVAAASLEDAHRTAAALATPDWIEHRSADSFAMNEAEAPDLKVAPPEVDAVSSKKAHWMSGIAPAFIPRRAGPRRSEIPSAVSELLRRSKERGDTPSGQGLNGWIKKARGELDKHFFKGRGDGWWDKTMKNMGGTLDTVLDAMDFAGATKDDVLSDPDVQRLGQLAMVAV